VINGKPNPALVGGDYQAKGCKEVELSSVDTIKTIMKEIEASRSCAAHQMNHRSSRSHCIVTLTCTRKTGNKMQQSKFLFVDLAGSERLLKSGVTNQGA